MTDPKRPSKSPTEICGSSVEPLIWVNGEWQAKAAYFDRGLFYGDGLFETVLCVNGSTPFWPRHLERMLKGAGRLKIQITPERLQAALSDFLASNEINFKSSRCAVKILLTRGQGGKGYDPSGAEHSNIFVESKHLTSSQSKALSGVGLVSSSHHLPINMSLAKIKHLNRLDYVIAAQSCELKPEEEVLLLDCENRVVESLHHNLFVVKDKQLRTPILDACGVQGVMRDWIIEQGAAKLGIECLPVYLNKQELVQADEIFICNSVRGIWPVISCDKKLFTIGTLTRTLQDLLKQEFGGLYEC